MKAVGIIFILFASIFIGVGGTMAWRQDYKIKHWKPVKAVIVSCHVERHESTDSKGHRSVNYSPEISFRYKAGTGSQDANGALPLSQSSSSAWASGICNRFKAGQEVTAWVNPENPAEGFVVRQYSFLPYIFILFPMVFVAAGILVCAGSGASVTKPPTPVMRGEWFDLKPARSIAGKKAGSWFAAILWGGVGAVACGHYFAVANRPYETVAIVMSVIYLLLTTIPVGMAIYNTLLSKVVGEAHVFVNRGTLQTGTPVKVGVRQPVFTPVQVQEAAIGLKCEMTTRTRSGNKTHYSTNTCYEEMKPVLRNQMARAGSALEYSVELLVPPGGMPSTRANDGSYPKYRWQIALRTQLADSPDYRADFPVMVEGTGAGNMMYAQAPQA